MKKITLLSLFLLTIAAYGQELISDGSFEGSSGTPDASSSPWKAAGSSNLDIPNNSALANTGDKSLRFFVSTDQIFVYQDITAEANTTYTLSLSYFVNATETALGERPLISIRKGDYPTGSFLVANTPLDLSTTAGSYIDYSLTFTTDAETNLEFYIVRRNTDKQLRFDDISIRKTSTWDGSDSSDWATAANWDNNSVPTSETIVNIPASGVTNEPTVSGTTGAAAYDLTVDGARTLTVSSGGSLIASNSSSGNVTYSMSIPDDAWHLVTSPVVGEGYDNDWVSANSIASGTSSNRGISTYQNGALDGTTGPWVYMQAGGSGSFSNGVGYGLKRTGAGDYSFTGTLNTASTPAISQNVSNWNLLGNSYTSYMDVSAFITANSGNLSGAFQAIYVWNGSSYTELTSGYIQPGQAFFVNSNVASGNASITAAMQSHQTGVTFYKNANPSITLSLSDGSNSRNTTINFLAGKTKALDPGFDIGMFDGVSSDIRVYSHLVENNEGVSFKRQALPLTEIGTAIVPIGVKANENKEITFTLASSNLPEGVKVYLEDRVLNTFTQLNELNSEYKLSLSEGINGVGRFYLHTSTTALSTVDVTSFENVSIYKSGSSTLKIANISSGKTSLKLFNVLGKNVLSASFISDGSSEIDLPKLSTGVYIVQLKNEQGTLNKKIAIE